MFRIGEFSRLARVSCRLLRYYDQIGLLTPAGTDTSTGYRYYRAHQLEDLNRVLVLRDLGLPLEQIARLVERNMPPAELRGMLEMRREEVQRSLDDEARRLHQIESRLAQLESRDEDISDDVMVRREPARRLLSLRTTVGSFDAGLRLVALLVSQVPRRLDRSVLGQFVALAHSPEFEPGEIDVEMGFYLEGPWQDPIALEDGRALTVGELPAVDRMVNCVRVGPPQDAHATTARIGRYLDSAGLAPAGPNRELFLRRPHPDRMAEAIVEMQFPVAPVSATAPDPYPPQ